MFNHIENIKVKKYQSAKRSAEGAHKKTERSLLHNLYIILIKIFYRWRPTKQRRQEAVKSVHITRLQTGKGRVG